MAVYTLHYFCQAFLTLCVNTHLKCAYLWPLIELYELFDINSLVYLLTREILISQLFFSDNL